MISAHETEAGQSAAPGEEEVTSTVPESMELAVVGGMKRHAGLGDGRKFRVARTGITFLGKMKFEEWRELLGAWKLSGDLYDLGLADILAYGKTEFGEQKVDESLELFSFDMADALRAHAIGQITLDLRLPTLTGEHYYVLATELPNAKREQGKWAAIADKESLSALELKKSIQAGKVVKTKQIEEQSGRNSGIPNIEGIGHLFTRWEKQIGGEGKILEQPIDWKRRFLAEVDPIVDVAQKVRESLPLAPGEVMGEQGAAANQVGPEERAAANDHFIKPTEAQVANTAEAGA